MSARSPSDARAITSAAVGPVCPIRMSSGPSRRKEKPRPAWSSCIEDTPTSITTPSIASTPCAAQISARSEKRPSTSISRPAERSTSPAPPAIAVRSRSMAMSRPRHLQDRAAIAAGAKSGVDIDAALARSEMRDGLPAKDGDVRNRAHAKRLPTDRPDIQARSGTNKPITPRIITRRGGSTTKPSSSMVTGPGRPRPQTQCSQWNLSGSHGISNQNTLWPPPDAGRHFIPSNGP